MAQYFSSTTAARLTGASVRQVGYWTRRVLRPGEAGGKGHRRRYTFRDLVALRTIEMLMRGGCSLQTIRKVIPRLMTRYQDNTPTQALARRALLADGKRVLEPTDEHQVMEVLTRQIVFSVPMANVIEEMSRRVEATPQRWTEKVLVGGKAFRIDVRRTGRGEPYVAQSRELPGAAARADDAAEAVAVVKQSIQSVLAMTGQRPARAGARRARPA